MRKRGPRKMGGEAAHFWCPFVEFGRDGPRFLMVFLEDFARASLIISNDNRSLFGRSVRANFANFDKVDVLQTQIWDHNQ